MKKRSFLNRKKTGIITITGTLLMIYSSVFASYVDQLQDQSAEWVGNPTRLAATDSTDCIFYNPAGTVLIQDGLYASLGLQIIAFPNKVTVEDPSYPGQTTYRTSTPNAYVPNFYINYKQDNWAFYGSGNIIGGGGTLYWPNGLPNTNYVVRYVDSLNIWKSGRQYWSGTYGASVNVEQFSQMPALTAGGAYALNSMISLSAGARAVFADQGMTVSIDSSGLGTAGKYTAYEGEWKATGYCGILGIDVRPFKELNLAATFESLTKLDYRVDVDTDNSAASTLSTLFGYTDGKKYRFDLPSKLSMGAEYTVLPDLKLSLSGIIYLTQWGKYEKPVHGGYESYDLKTAYELGTGFDWQILKHVSWTGGINYCVMNLKDEQLSEGFIKNDLIDLGTGIRVRTDENFSVTISYMHNIYTEKENSKTINNTFTPAYKTKYYESADDVAIGVEYKFI